MRRLIWPVLFLLFMLLQGAGSVFYTGWLSCDLLLLALYAYAMLCGDKQGAVAGALVGFLQDTMTVGVFGYHIITRICVGYVIGTTKEKIFRDNFLYHMSAIATISIALRFVYWWLALIRSGGRWSIFFSYAWDSLGYVLGNVLLVWPVVVVMKLAYEFISKKEISYKDKGRKRG